MKIVVPVKRVVDPGVKIRVKPDGSGVDTRQSATVINPFDAIALEEALRLREAGLASYVLAVSCGGGACVDTLRSALAIGADRAILVEHENVLEQLAVARLLKAIVLREAPQLVLMGKQAIDSDANQVGQMLAAMLGWPQATFVSKLNFNEGHFRVSREIDGGIELLEVSLPAVVTTDLRLNEPRYATLPNIMKARKTPIERIDASTLALDIEPRLRILKVTEPANRRECVRLASAEELVMRLRGESGVI